MAEKMGTEPTPSQVPGLFGTLRNLWGLLLVILYTRLSLLTSELEEERERLEMLIVLGLFMLLFSGLGVISLTLLVIMLIWDSPYRLWYLGGLFIVFMSLSGVLAMIIRSQMMSKPRFLGQTLDELRRDVEGIRAVSKAVGESVL